MLDGQSSNQWPPLWQKAAERGNCVHCGNPLGNFWNKTEGPFCCRGCLNVYQMIHQESLERYYDLKPGSTAPSPNLRSDSFAWLDRLLSELADSSSSSGNSGTAESIDPTLHLDLDIQGVHCAACIWLIEELFQRQKAGIVLRINPTLGKVELIWNAEEGDLKVFLAEVEKFGYRLGPSRKGGPKHSRGLLMRMAISISMAMNVMMFSLSFYFGLAPSDGNLYQFFGWLSMILATVSLIAGGGIFFRGALAGLKRRVAHLDVPISLGMVLAYAGSVWGFFTGGPEDAYFDSLTIFIALMLVGRWAQEHILERNRNALLDSSGAENLTVKRLVKGNPEAIAATDVQLGDELWLAPGDLLPVEGTLMRRATEVALDWITGESDQIAFQPGDTIPAGAFNASHHGFTVTSNEDFIDSRLNDLLRSSTISDEDFRPQWWHNISSWYVTLVLVAASSGFAIWARTDIALALKVTISILVVTCPCALGLATPLAEELVHFALRRGGVFLRKASFMEKALSVRKVLLDKTGTLTMGHLILDQASLQSLSQLNSHQQAVLKHMTLRSNHPVSQCLAIALAKLADTDGNSLKITTEELIEIPGSGLELPFDGDIWRLGKAGFALNKPGQPANQTLLTINNQLLASFNMREELKADAAAELSHLKDAGFDVYLLSGDSQAKVDLAARALGVETEKAHGGLDPRQKAALVRSLDNNDTLMVGDGLNDSPSFEVALCAATPAVDRPVLPGKADFYFMGDGIAAIRRSLLAARHLRKVVRDNLIIAIAYNGLAVALCLAGLVTPVVAAILMPVSSIAVVSLTTLRLATRRLPWM